MAMQKSITDNKEGKRDRVLFKLLIADIARGRGGGAAENKGRELKLQLSFVEHRAM